MLHVHIVARCMVRLTIGHFSKVDVKHGHFAPFAPKCIALKMCGVVHRAHICTHHTTFGAAWHKRSNLAPNGCQLPMLHKKEPPKMSTIVRKLYRHKIFDDQLHL